MCLQKFDYPELSFNSFRRNFLMANFKKLGLNRIMFLYWIMFICHFFENDANRITNHKLNYLRISSRYCLNTNEAVFEVMGSAILDYDRANLWEKKFFKFKIHKSTHKLHNS